LRENMKLIKTVMRGMGLKYGGAILSVLIISLLGFISPLVISVTIDSFIGTLPISAPDFIIRMVQNMGGREYIAQNLWLCALVLAAVALLNGAFSFLRGFLTAQASEGIAKNLREVLYEHLQKLPYDYHVKVQTGDLIQRCTSDVETIRRFLANQLVEMCRVVFVIAVSVVLMVMLDWKMTLASLCIVPILFFTSMFYYKKVQKTFRTADEAEGLMQAALQENLTGVRVVRAFGQEKKEIDKFDFLSADYRNKAVRINDQMGIYWGVTDMLSYLQSAAVLVLGVVHCVQGGMTLGLLTVFCSYVNQMLWPVRAMGRILADWGKAQVSFDRISEIINAKPEEDPPDALKPEIRGDIVFDNVVFGYDAKKPVLDGVSFTLPEGQTMAILGATGSGKSSLVHLLQRLYDYRSGSITIGGVELKNIERKWLRRHIGIVLQEPFLFSKTIMENIALAKPGASAEDVYEAARIASVHDVIGTFDKGYETVVGERGVTLSGGQKQRVAIARMLIGKSPVLIFDDSLSAVDTETDAQIRAALKERRKGASTIIISHRVTTLAEADFIIVLENGKVAQQGTHEQLIAQEGLYRRIWAIQGALEAQETQA